MASRKPVTTYLLLRAPFETGKTNAQIEIVNPKNHDAGEKLLNMERLGYQFVGEIRSTLGPPTLLKGFCWDVETELIRTRRQLERKEGHHGIAEERR